MDLSFSGEFFQDVVDLTTGNRLPIVADGEPFGFSGRFSHLSAGETVQASFSVDTTVDGWEFSDCMFAGTACGSAFASVSRDLSTLFLADTGTSLTYNFVDNTALYYEDGPGGRTGLGLFRFYGAEFDIASVRVDDPSIVPLPASGWVLLAALGALGTLGFARRRRTS